MLTYHDRVALLKTTGRLVTEADTFQLSSELYQQITGNKPLHLQTYFSIFRLLLFDRILCGPTLIKSETKS